MNFPDYKSNWAVLRDMQLSELSELCHSVARELTEQKLRTPTERRDLAEHTSKLLAAVGDRICPSPHKPHNPERTADNDPNRFYHGFVEWYEQEARSVRHWAIHRAADWVLKGQTNTWMETWVNEPSPPQVYWTVYYSAIHNDEGFRKQLRTLERMLLDRVNLRET